MKPSMSKYVRNIKIWTKNTIIEQYLG